MLLYLHAEITLTDSFYAFSIYSTLSLMLYRLSFAGIFTICDCFRNTYCGYTSDYSFELSELQLIDSDSLSSAISIYNWLSFFDFFLYAALLIRSSLFLTASSICFKDLEERPKLLRNLRLLCRRLSMKRDPCSECGPKRLPSFTFEICLLILFIATSFSDKEDEPPLAAARFLDNDLL